MWLNSISHRFPKREQLIGRKTDSVKGDRLHGFRYIKRVMERETANDSDAAIEILAPAEQCTPLVFSSPHSGREYPADFLAASKLDALAIRRSEDSFVDELFAQAPHLGAPLLKALFPRAFVDPNREPYELDPSMFTGPLPGFVNRRSPRVAAGLGTIARVVANGSEIYSCKLDFDEAHARIERCYRPYHDALEDLITQTRTMFGTCILIDCHSMPSIGGPMENDAGRRRQIDFILGDVHGRSCARPLTMLVEETLRGMGYSVVRNTPYSGGFITRNYGRPERGVHALQIETNRALYMNETTFERTDGLAEVARHMSELVERLVELEPAALAA
jgi:N-formylglutamate amidohydrolase